jgi:hypothetical protein
MKQGIRAVAPTMIAQNRRPPHDKASIRVPLRAADARRSVNNILQWNTYLPANCVRTMVRMGWDYTT